MQSFSASAPGILKHPLLRGADRRVIELNDAALDSSPPARGRLGVLFSYRSVCRFIPSCEGQTKIITNDNGFQAIHPLLRGADACI